MVIVRFFRRIKNIKYLLADRSVKWYKKAAVIAGLLYLVLPVDLIPPVLFPFGFIDDLVIWILLLWFLGDDLDKYSDTAKSTVDYSKKYKRKNVVDVEYTVDENDDEGDEKNESAN